MRRLLTLVIAVAGILMGTATPSNADLLDPSSLIPSSYATTYVQASRTTAYIGTAPMYVVPGESITMTVAGYRIAYRVEKYVPSSRTWTQLVAGQNQGWVPQTAVTFTSPDPAPQPGILRKSSDKPPTAAPVSQIRVVSVASDGTGRVFTSPTQTLITTLPTSIPASNTFSLWGLINTANRSQPSRWNPCQPIPVRIDPSSARSPKKSKRDAVKAINYIREATGLPLKFAGKAALDNNQMSLPGYGIDIDWSNEGINGPDHEAAGGAFANANYLPNAPFQSISAAKIVINAPVEPGTVAARQHLLRHELMHAIGAAHPSGGSSILNDPLRNVLGAGDAILAQVLGSPAGCF